MIKVYKGPIKRLELNLDNIEKLENASIKESIIVKDSMFYKNIFGNIVNFEYDTVLFSRNEAMEGIKSQLFPHILFVDYGELKYFDDLEKKEVNEIKKMYKSKK